MGVEGRASPTQERWYRKWEVMPAARAFPPFRQSQHLLLHGPLERGALAAAVAALVGRHPGVRSAVGWRGEALWQTVCEPGSRRWLEVQDGEGPDDPDDPDAGAVAREFLDRPLDPSTGDVFRAALIGLGRDRHRLLVTLDH